MKRSGREACNCAEGDEDVLMEEQRLSPAHNCLAEQDCRKPYCSKRTPSDRWQSPGLHCPVSCTGSRHSASKTFLFSICGKFSVYLNQKLSMDIFIGLTLCRPFIEGKFEIGKQRLRCLVWHQDGAFQRALAAATPPAALQRNLQGSAAR